MFVKLLALLISNVLVCFSVLFCCRLLVSKCGLQDENFSKCTSSPCQCPRAHYVWSSALRSNPVEKIERTEPRSSAMCLSARSAIKHMPHQPHISRCPSRHRFTPCAVGILSGYVWLSALSCDRAHTGLRLSTLHMIERTFDLATH